MIVTDFPPNKGDYIPTIIVFYGRVVGFCEETFSAVFICTCLRSPYCGREQVGV
jgi:hypothetical protein